MKLNSRNYDTISFKGRQHDIENPKENKDAGCEGLD